MVNRPFVFPATNPSEARLAFKLYAIGSAREPCRLIGSAAYLLESDKDCAWANRESLARERTIPILEKSTMDIIGAITFTFVIVKPLVGSDTVPLVKQKSRPGVYNLSVIEVLTPFNQHYTAIYSITD